MLLPLNKYDEGKRIRCKKLISCDWVVSEHAQIQFLCHNPKHVDFTQEERCWFVILPYS